MSALPWHNGDFKWHEAWASRKKTKKNKSGVHIGDVGWSAAMRSGHIWGCLGWFHFLSWFYLALRSCCQQSRRPLQFHRHKLFMLALINSLCICNETRILIETWKRSSIHSPPPPSVVHHMSVYRSWDSLNPHVYVHLSKLTRKQIRRAFLFFFPPRKWSKTTAGLRLLLSTL